MTLETPLIITTDRAARQYLGLTVEQFAQAVALGYIRRLDIVRSANRYAKSHLVEGGQRYIDDLMAGQLAQQDAAERRRHPA